MRIKLDTARLGKLRWYEYLVRFVFGGIVTALAGFVAKRFGAEIGGFFLAFPAILPATATLVEKHERKKKERDGQSGTGRGRTVAGIDAAGAAMGSIGLVAFALAVWKCLPQSALGMVLTGATLAWLVTSLSLWELRETVWRRARTDLRRASNRRLRTSAHHSPSRCGPSENRKFDE